MCYLIFFIIDDCIDWINIKPLLFFSTCFFIKILNKNLYEFFLFIFKDNIKVLQLF